MKHCVAYGIMHSPVHAAAALYVRGHVGVFVVSQSGLAMIVHCVLSPLPYSLWCRGGERTIRSRKT